MIWLWLLACGGSAETACDAERPCGWAETCVQGTCVAGLCATSAQCPPEHFCTGDQCVPGCAVDEDCYPGDRCVPELATCEPGACEDTQVDCGFREYCDTTTGTCFDAGEQFCRPCERDSQCGEGNRCWNDYCGVDCNDRECPAGFDCSAFRDSFGNIETYQCITYCAFYLE